MNGIKLSTECVHRWCRWKTSYLHLTNFSGGKKCLILLGSQVQYIEQFVKERQDIYERVYLIIRLFQILYRVSESVTRFALQENYTCRYMRFFTDTDAC